MKTVKRAPIGELADLAYVNGFSYDLRGGDQIRVTYRYARGHRGESGGDCGTVFVGTRDECVAFLRGWVAARTRFEESP